MPRQVNSATAAAVDTVGVVVFCALGRRSHDEALTPAGIAHTAWPFLTGTAAGWLVSRGWRQPSALRPTGVAVWLCTVVVGMGLRKATGQSVAPAFVAVASTVTAVLLLGWRGLTASRRH